MGYWQRLTLVFFLALACLPIGCERDGFQCSSNDDCFAGEECQAGTCVAACDPETDADLCASAAECGENLTFTDRCGESREVTCDCPENNISCSGEPSDVVCMSAGAECGELTATDGCDEPTVVGCGECSEPLLCVENQCVRCAPPTCPDSPDTCGIARNLCGDEVVCGGTCGDGELCVDARCSAPVLAPAPLSPGDRFGEEIRVSDNLLAIGAPQKTVGGVERAGAIFVYHIGDDGIYLLHQLELEDPEEDDAFGRVFDLFEGRLLAAAGDRLVSYDVSNDPPLIPATPLTIMRRVEEITLRSRSEFLIAFALQPSGATLYAGTCSASGCEVGNPWTPQAPQAGELGLGFAMDTADGVSLVGAPFDDVPGQNQPEPAGSFYWLGETLDGVPDPTGWDGGPSQFTFDTFNDTVGSLPTERAGHSVALNEDGFAVVGAPHTTPANLIEESGVLFVFSPTEAERWRNIRRLVSPADTFYTRCGQAVTVQGSSVFISCMHDATLDDDVETAIENRTAGLVRRYDHVNNTWELSRDIYQAPMPRAYDHYGWTLERSPGQIFVGAPGRGENRGEVHILPLDR